ncbi:hypothetical protein O181_107381 [Austropuccinia psidii MF-1]|uniref:Uncharacterized protein n=1 Tax=Austropuccinia psidii MF-1 TaxID=1389203 RepID=A0A9Q3PP26_9BASI|nr:hypothetical protein [Austropuccinia psidii MF-1]
MICLVLALNIDLKMSSKLTSICDSDHSDSPPSVLYGAGVFDNLRELSEESMAPTEIWDINKAYNGFKSVRVIEPACINWVNSAILEKEIVLKPTTTFLTIPEDYEAASRRVEYSDWKLLLMNLPPLMPPLFTPILQNERCQQWNNTSSYWANIGGSIHPQGNPIGVAPEVPILVTRKNGKLGKLKRNLVVQHEIDADAEGSDEIDGEELEITTPIQKRRIQSTSQSPVQASTTNNEVIRSPQPPQLPIRSPTTPSTLSSTSTSIQPPVASTSRDPMSPEPESIFETRHRWNITGNFTDQKRVNKKVVTSLFAEVDALTEVFVDKAMKSAIPGEPTIALAKEEVAY